MSTWQDRLKQGLSSAATIAAGAVRQAAVVAKDLAEDLTSFKALKDYRLAGHVATAGPNHMWKIFMAVSKKPGAVFPEVSVWILDKKALNDAASRSGRARGFDAFFEQQRRSCSQMLRIKHPGVIKVVEALEETGSQMVMVTEPVFGSVANLLTQFRDVPTAGEDRQSTVPSPLELKYGLMHVAEAVQFLNGDASTVHCNLGPETLVVAKDGVWKLSGFAFAAPATEFGAQGQSVAFEYGGSMPPLWDDVTRPSLPYTAPELVAGTSSSSEARITPACDVFSLGAIAYELLSGKQLLPVGSSGGEYRARLGLLGSADMSAVPPQLQGPLRSMVAPSPSARPTAAAFASCQWFQEDMLLRALKFLDGMLQRDAGQKAAFLKDLGNFWCQYDERLLRHRVLPPIVQEMRNEMVQLAALPVVLAIMGKMSSADVDASGVLPVLRPIFETADGEMLLALIRNVHLFQRVMTGEAKNTVLVPLILRACDSPNPKAQEEVLKNIPRLVLDMDYNILKDALVPKMVAMCLRTTSAVVRSAAMALMAQVVPRLDRGAADKMLEVCAQVVAVDKSAGTTMAVLRVGDAVSKHYGAEATAQRVLPMLCPLLLSPGLNAAQFAAFAKAVREMLERIEEKRTSELGTAPAAAVAGAAAAGTAGAPRGGVVSAAGAGGSGLDDGLGPGVSNGASAMSGSASWTDGSRGSSKPKAAAAPSASLDWKPQSSGAAAASTSALGGAGANGGTLDPWSAAPQPPRAAAGASPTGSAGAVPDIFSSGGPGTGGAGDMFGSLGISAAPPSTSAGPAWGATSKPSYGGPARSGGVASNSSSDMFGGLAAIATAPAAGSRQQQRVAAMPVSPPALQPPPAAKTPIRISSSGSGDLFSGLAMGSGGGAGPSGSAAAASSLAASAGQDPFRTLAGAGGSSSVPNDPFASLAASSSSRQAGPSSSMLGGPSMASAASGGIVGTAGAADAFAGLVGPGSATSMNAMRRQAPQQQQAPQEQQQQQQWQWQSAPSSATPGYQSNGSLI